MGKYNKNKDLDLLGKVELAERLLIEQAENIAKSIHEAHICVKFDPAIVKLIGRVYKLNEASKNFHEKAGVFNGNDEKRFELFKKARKHVLSKHGKTLKKLAK